MPHLTPSLPLLCLTFSLGAIPLMGAGGCDTDNDEDGYTLGDGDCDDSNPQIYPGAVEVCDEADSNCDGAVDNDIRCYPDLDPQGLYFPPTSPGDKTWLATSPLALGWDEAGLDALGDYAEAQSSQGLILLYRGHIIMERYWDGWDVDQEGTIYSASKSMVGWVVGQAQEQGLLDINASAQSCLGQGWSQATPEQEAQITLRHLLTMTSGLRDDLTVEAAPGEEWYYNNDAYYTLQECLVSVYGMDLQSLFEAQLFHPTGMWGARWPEGKTRIDATSRDMARFGLLVLGEGRWDDQQLLAEAGYQEEMLSPSQSLNPGYGYLWWLNGQEAFEMPGGELGTGSIIPSAPDDVVSAQGAGDKKIYISPSMELVVVRHGPGAPDSGDSTLGFDVALWEHIMAAAPR